MPSFIIKGGKKLKGEIKIAGNKNAMLPVFAACLLTKEKCVIKNVPDIADGEAMLQILMSIGVKVERIDAHTYSLRADRIQSVNLNPELTKKLRGCITLMGALTARFRKMSMHHPGGCLIGKRPLDAHLQVMQSFGAEVRVGNSRDNTPVYSISNKNYRGTNLFLEEQSVTATENAVLMAVLAPGRTKIENAASEPHVRDLIACLNKMGAKIKGAGTNILEITGVKKLRGVRHELVSDHIEAISFACLAAASGGNIKLTGIAADDLKMALIIFNKMGVHYKLGRTTLQIFPGKFRAADKIQDGLWPALPTDAISPFIVLATQARGTTLIHQWMFEGRLFFIDKLIRMGAKIVLCDPHRALITGPSKLRAKAVESPDIRAGIALLIAGLVARGATTIDNAYQIERGYENIIERLRKVGADISRVP